MNPFLSPNTENRAWIFAPGHLLSLILLCNSHAIIRAVLYCLLFACTLGSPAAVRTQQLLFKTRQLSAAVEIHKYYLLGLTCLFMLITPALGG